MNFLNEIMNDNQELIRQQLLEIIKYHQVEKGLGKGEWKHCQITFKTTKEFIEHWKKCSNIPDNMSYKDTLCQKCWLVEKCVLNNNIIYQHQCPGVEQRPKPKFVNQIKEIQGNLAGWNKTMKILKVVGLSFLILLVIGISYLVWKVIRKK